VQVECNGARSNSLTKVRVWRCIAETPPVLANSFARLRLSEGHDAIASMAKREQSRMLSACKVTN
jgi:hypothetical protein